MPGAVHQHERQRGRGRGVAAVGGGVARFGRQVCLLISSICFKLRVRASAILVTNRRTVAGDRAPRMYSAVVGGVSGAG
ncbi:hypothetical protein A33K_17423 [Burkholderia humptydooensis MSMB43]|uniref:Uncharacterized protein n=1 Tax=Burkholderia humptydooensis MSMB43 TaxID=441157 RepID=A0ABN0G2H1_9BURK|nr:hypothetical protein A33K_17423 [Burkholderia humptydooensis MSMB43]